MVEAFVLIQTEVGKAAQVAAALADLEGVVRSSAVTGPYDVIVDAQAGDIDALVITKLDVLDGLDEIRAAVAYRLGSELRDSVPASLDGVEPQYETVPGWRESTEGCRKPEDLPARAREYLQFVADQCGCPVAIVSVGQERSAMLRFDPWLQPR